MYLYKNGFVSYWYVFYPEKQSLLYTQMWKIVTLDGLIYHWKSCGINVLDKGMGGKDVSTILHKRGIREL